MCTILQAIQESFVLIGDAEAAAEVKDGIVISQGQVFQEFCQIFESVADFQRVIFVGFLISLVELIQNGFSIAVAGVKGMCFYIGFQQLGDVSHCRSTPPG